jgi:hypothetical protein
MDGEHGLPGYGRGGKQLAPETRQGVGGLQEQLSELVTAREWVKVEMNNAHLKCLRCPIAVRAQTEELAKK